MSTMPQKPKHENPKSLHLVATAEFSHVQATRKRVSRLTPEQRRRICYLFDATGGDADYAAERCGVVKIQRADVLAVVLADTRKGSLAA